MKLLLENWRGHLNERATDETYSEVINFIINAYSTAKNFEPPDVEKREAEWDAIAKILGSEDGWASLGLQAKDDVEKEPPEKQLVTHELMFDEERTEEIYDEMVSSIPESRSFFTYSDFYDTFFALNIKLYYVDSDGDPESETYEEKKGASTGGYYTKESDDHGLPQVAVNFGSNFFNPKISYAKFQNLKKPEIFKLLKQNKGVLRMILVHEFTHMLNRGRARALKGMMAKQYRKGKSRKKETEYQKAYAYANSTEEIQARLIPIFNITSAAIRGENIGNSPVNEIAKLIALEAMNTRNKKNIIKLLFKMYDIQHKNFLNHTSEKNKKRISKRFYEFAKEITGV